jgi:Endomembrane protein 70
MHSLCCLLIAKAHVLCRYTRDEDDVESLERDATEESGWKLVHGDVFRPPRHPELLSALVGTGEPCLYLRPGKMGGHHGSGHVGQLVGSSHSIDGQSHGQKSLDAVGEVNPAVKLQACSWRCWWCWWC